MTGPAGDAGSVSALAAALVAAADDLAAAAGTCRAVGTDLHAADPAALHRLGGTARTAARRAGALREAASALQDHAVALQQAQLTARLADDATARAAGPEQVAEAAALRAAAARDADAAAVRLTARLGAPRAALG